MPLTPIQRWFLEIPMPSRNRWCLSAVLFFVIALAGYLDKSMRSVAADQSAAA